ncbi:MAG: cobamide remodeling phosphodiesterase CbiR [Candidatus Heimdallarchaeaceae archaeon]
MHKLLFGHRPFDFADIVNMVILDQNNQPDLSKLDYFAVMQQSIEAGFKHIELTADLLYVFPELITPEKIQLLANFSKKAGISFSVHLPLWAIEPAAFSHQIRKASVETFIETIELTKALDPCCYVVHATGALTVEFLHMKMPEMLKGLVVQQFTHHAAEALKILIEKTNIPPRKIAVENIEYPFKQFYPIIEELDLGVCFDTGHLLAGYSGEIEVMEFIDRYYDRIIELHLHDGEYPKIDHKPLGTHKLPTRELLLELYEREFSGPIVYELTLDEAKQSIDYIQSYVPEIFR